MNLTFFPMHIVGLLGMPRRQYTYPGGLGWETSNLIETIGAYVLAVGLIIILANVVVSYRRGPRAGADPFGGDTLEWSVSSPPPPYNFPAIPRVSTPYPMWDRKDRENDEKRLAEGELVLEEGHETPASTVLDAEWDEILDMPSKSWAPVLIALALGVVFTMLLLQHYVTALAFLALSGLVVAVWHWREPQMA
jgi:cytochrome c oxidase subunit I+III